MHSQNNQNKDSRAIQRRIQEFDTGIRDGFTLIETALALTVLLIAVLTGAHLFTYAEATSHRAGQRAQGAVLVALKAEAIQAEGSAPAPGGSLDPGSPLTGFHEYLKARPDGLWDTVSQAGEATHLRVWRIGTGTPADAEVAVYALGAGGTRPLAYARLPWR